MKGSSRGMIQRIGNYSDILKACLKGFFVLLFCFLSLVGDTWVVNLLSILAHKLGQRPPSQENRKTFR